MSNSRISSVAIFLITLLFAATGQAATFTVDQLDDSLSDGVCGVGTCTFRDALDAANANTGDADIINVPAGTITIANYAFDNTNDSGDFDILGPVEIVGAGSEGITTTTIRSNGTVGHHVFHEMGGAINVTLRNIRIADATQSTSTLQGGCMWVDAAHVTLDNVVFENCQGENGGGYFHNTSGSLNIMNSKFINNRANDSCGIGGAIRSDIGLTITDSHFMSNTSVCQGGAIFYSGGTLTLEGDNRFENNGNDQRLASGEGRGGAIYGQNALQINDTMGNSVFVGNYGAGGGAVWIENTHAITINGAHFERNRVTTDVGGGAVRVHTTGAAINRSTFISNTSSAGGGGLYTGLAPNVTDVHFENNTATNGGGMYSAITPNVTDSTFVGNTANEGGGLYVPAGEGANITSSYFISNSATAGNGGGSHTPKNAVISDSTYLNNTATAFGGGAHAYNTTTITGSYFEGNEALNGSNTGEGGAIFVDANGIGLTIKNSTVIRNKANKAGGIAVVDPIFMYNTTVAYNEAQGHADGGGGISLERAGSFIYNSTFYLNTTNQAGKPNNILDISTNASTVKNTILYNGSSTNPNCSKASTQYTTANNLDSNTDGATTCGNTAAGGSVMGINSDALLKMATDVADNGGPTKTMALLATSPAIDAGNTTTCSDANVANLDQRGVARPQNGGVSLTCDIGAFEYLGQALTVTLEGDGTGTVTSSGTMSCTTGSCVEGFGDGSLVTLTATKNTGSVFAGWSGAECSGVNVNCVITMDQAKSVTANFILGDYIVTKEADTNDGTCDVTDCSLREAVKASNAAGGTQTIVIPAGTYAITLGGVDEDAGNTGDFDLTDPAIFKGVGKTLTIIDGNLQDRVFDVPDTSWGSASGTVFQDLTVKRGKLTADGGGCFDLNGSNFTFERVVITGCDASGNGGAIRGNQSLRVTVKDSSITSNVSGGMGGGAYLIANASSYIIASFENSIIHDNESSGSGTGLRCNHTNCELHIVDSAVTSNVNTTTTNDGGGVSAQGDLYVTRSTVFDNHTNGGGGGLHSDSNIVVTDSTISNNSSLKSGGGILTWSTSATIEVYNSTISGNNANGQGGGAIYTGARCNISNSTIHDNNQGWGGAVHANGGAGLCPITHTIISNNTNGATNHKNCNGNGITSLDYNIDTGTTCGFVQANDQSSATTLSLMALGNYGGPTKTHALPGGSIAIDAGDSSATSVCTKYPTNNSDQRGWDRVVNGGTSATCDIGAFEYDSTSDITPPNMINSLATGTVTDSSVELTWTATGDDGSSGTASQYDLRYSTSNIATEADFQDAIRVTDVAAPKAATLAESYTITGLSTGVTYYFAIKAIDDVGLESTFSNVVSATPGGGGGSTIVSGMVYLTEGANPVADNTIINLVVNGTSVGTDTTVGGAYSIDAGTLTAGDKLLVYIDDNANDGNTVTVSDGGALANLDIYVDHLIVRHDNGGSMTHTFMSTAKGGLSDVDILYSVASNNLTVDGAATELYVPASHGYSPEGTISSAHFKNLGNTTLGGVMTLAGNFSAVDGIVDTSVTGYAISVGGNFSQVFGSEVRANSSTLTVTGNFSADGSVDGVTGDAGVSDNYNNATLIMNGGSSTLTYDRVGSSWLNGFNNLTMGHTGAIDTVSGTFAVLGVLTVYDGEITGTNWMYIRGDGNPLALNSAAKVSIGGLMFNGLNQTLPGIAAGYDTLIAQIRHNGVLTQSADVTLNAGYDLLIHGNNVDANVITYKTDGFNLTVGGDLVIGGTGTDTGLKQLDTTTASARASTISVKGNYTLTAGTVDFVKSNSTVVLNGSTAQTITTGGDAFNNFQVDNNNALVTFADNLSTTNFTATKTNTQLTFTGGITINVSGTLDINGQGLGTEVVMRSTNTSQYFFNVTGGVQSVNFVDVQYSAALGSDINAYDSLGAITGFNDDTGASPHWVFMPSVTHDLTVSIPGGNGGISANSGDIACPGVCVDAYGEGLVVQLTANPSTGYEFTSWGGACLGELTNVCNVTMDTAKSVTVAFSITTHQLSVDVIGTSGTVSDTPTPPGVNINCTTGTCNHTYDYNTAVTLTATPDADHEFDGWTGCDSATGNECNVSMTTAKNITATFSTIQHNLGVTISGSGGYVNTNPPNSDCSTGTCNYLQDQGTSVTLTAVITTGYQLDSWTGCDSFTGNECTVSMSAAKDVTAAFSITTHQLDMTVNGTSGAVTDGGSLNCTTGTCQVTYDYNTAVTLTANPDIHHKFDGWGGDCSAFTTNPDCNLTITSATTASATFSVLPQYALDVTISGSDGAVTSNIGTISCSTGGAGTCSNVFYSDQTVVLTAGPQSGYKFTGWSGYCTNTSGTCEVPMTAVRTVTASFEIIPTYTLSINVTGLPGTVNSDLGAISCGTGNTGTCQDSYLEGTVVTLTPVAESGSAFSGWSGGTCSGLLPCEVTITGNITVDGSFDDLPRVTVNVVGDVGSGQVTSHSGVINCPDTECTEQFDGRSYITLSAEPNAGYYFAGWDYASCPDTLPCNVLPTGVQTVTATFMVDGSNVPQTYTVTKSNDTNDGICSASDCSLREAITASNQNVGAVDTIVIPEGVYHISLEGLNELSNVSGDFNIGDSVIINGAGMDKTYIVGDQLERVFRTHVTGFTGSIVYRDMTIQDGKVTGTLDGGCIHAQSALLTFERVRFTNCLTDDIAGAVYATVQPITIIDSEFTNNSAGSYGGAIYAAKLVDITNSTFSENYAGITGGAVFVNTGGSVKISGASTLFYKNEANTGKGGAIHSPDGVEISGGNFSQNKSATFGGAINVNGLTSYSISITDATFTENQSGGGGALYLPNGGSILRTTFTSNKALDNAGGGFRTNSNTVDLNVTDSIFTSNTSYKAGAGFYASGKAVVSGSTFEDNHTTSILGADNPIGGALYSNSNGVEISNSILKNNSANEHGGAVYSSSYITITDSVVSGNEAGDTVSGLLGNAGGVYSNGDGVTITRSSFENNVSNNTSGAVFANGSVTTLDRSTFSGNVAGNDGGVVYTNGTLMVSNSTLSGNHAVGRGGAVYANDCDVLNSTIYGNSTDIPGGVGGLNVWGSCTYQNSIVAYNTPINCVVTRTTSTGYNLTDEASNTCNFVQTGDQMGFDPRLMPLAMNGGPTKTHALMSDSPAIERGYTAVGEGCDSPRIGNVDQRGVVRPIDRNQNGTAICDVGAYEYEINTVAVSVVGSGSVSSSPVGIDCPSNDCSYGFGVGGDVTLTAAPTLGSGYEFSNWGGDCSAAGSSTTCLLSAISNGAVVEANFVLSVVNHLLTVSKVGFGDVVASSGAISCGATCSDSYTQGLDVVLTATPSVGYQFDGWSGAGCESAGTDSCTVTMSMAQAVTANFSIIPYDLAVDVVGWGTVVSSPEGINCGKTASCTAGFNHGQVVTLTVTVMPGYTFMGWGSDCVGSGTNLTCDVTMDANKQVTAMLPTVVRPGTFDSSEHGGKDAAYPDRVGYPSGDGVTGVSREHIDASFANYPRGECDHCHDFFSLDPAIGWPMTFTVYTTKEQKVDFCGNCHTDADPDANGVDNDTPDDYSFQGPSAFKKSVHYSRNLQWPGGQYGTSYPAMPVEGAGTCINCHSPHAHAYNSEFANMPGGVDPSSIPFPKQLVELIDITTDETGIIANWPDGWPSVDVTKTVGSSTVTYLGRDPDDAEDLCYTCHDGDPVVNPSLSDYNTYMVAGDAPATPINSIKDAFNLAFHHPVMDSDQVMRVAAAVEAGETGMALTIPFKSECTTCHNPHLVSGKWDDFYAPGATDVDSPSPIVLPGVSAGWPDPAPANYQKGELWGDEPEEKVNALLRRVAERQVSIVSGDANRTYTARGTGGWKFNVDRGYDLEVINFADPSNLDQYPTNQDAFDQPPVYQPPYGGLGPAKGYQPAGDALPDFITFCLDCHKNKVGTKEAVYWGANWPISKAGKIEPHGFDAANMPPALSDGRGEWRCGYWCEYDSSPCRNTLSSEREADDPFLNKPMGQGYLTWSLPPYKMEDRMAGINYVLVCTDCHEPHGSPNKSLLRSHINGNTLETTDMENVCTSCHMPFGGQMLNDPLSCGVGAPVSCGGDYGCHGNENTTLHTMGLDGVGNQIILRDPNYSAEGFDDVYSCNTTERGLIGLWSPADSAMDGINYKDGTANRADIVDAVGAYSSSVDMLDTTTGGYFRAKRRDCHNLRYPDYAWNSGVGSEATQFTYEGKIEYMHDASTAEMMIADYSLGGAGSNWSISLIEPGGDPANSTMYLQVAINVWDQDQVTPWRKAISKVAVPLGDGTVGATGTIAIAARYDASDASGPLRVYINGKDVTDGLSGSWTTHSFAANPEYNQASMVGGHINTDRHEDDAVTGDPGGAPDGNDVVGWSATNLNPFLHFGVATTIDQTDQNITVAAGNKPFNGYLGKQRLFNSVLTADQICSNVLNAPGDAPWTDQVFETNIATDCP